MFDPEQDFGDLTMAYLGRLLEENGVSTAQFMLVASKEGRLEP